MYEVNSFNKRTNKWKHSQFTIKKFNNFFSCNLVFGQWDFEPGGYRDTEYLAKIISGLQKSLNFKLKINSLLDDKLTNNLHYVNPNLTVDLLIWHNSVNELKIGIISYHITQPFMFLPTKLVVPPGEAYDEYEKLLLPFDEHTWLLIGLTFIAAFSTIFFCKFMSASVRNFVFGRNVSSPSLNIFMIFCGIAQVVLPRRNFARFLVMMFILYSLIIRTAWQSQMFKFLQKEMRRPQIQSLDELIAKKLPLYVWFGFTDEVRETDLVQM